MANTLGVVLGIAYAIGSILTMFYAQYWAFTELGFVMWLFFGSWIATIASGLWPLVLLWTLLT